MKKIMLFSIIAVIALFTTYAYAQNLTEIWGFSPGYSNTFLGDINSNIGPQNMAVNEDEYPSFEEKYSNGVINIASSWVEIPEGIADTAQDENFIVASTIGLGKGIVSGIGRIVAGTYDLATLPIAPDEKPLLQAKYKVENPEEGFKIDILKW